MQPIQTRIKLLFSASAKDVSEDIAPDLLDFSYTDNENNEADEISVTLKDPEGKWASSWQPDKGEIVQATLLQGDVEKVTQALPCGKFYVDSMTVSGSPRIFNFKAISIPLDTGLRRKIVKRAFEKTTLKAIAGKIAGEGGLSLLFDADDVTYDRTDQKESNLAFLTRLCTDAGLSIKVADSKIAIFDQQKYETQSPVRTFVLGVSDILSWSFDSQQSDSYKSVTVTYRNPKENLYNEQVLKNTNAIKTFTYTDPFADENAQEYTEKQRVTTPLEAANLAKKRLRELNRRKVTGKLTIIGDAGMVAGVVVEVLEFGSFDGNFIVETATHTFNSSGYVTELSLRRVNTTY